MKHKCLFCMPTWRQCSFDLFWAVIETWWTLWMIKIINKDQVSYFQVIIPISAISCKQRN